VGHISSTPAQAIAVAVVGGTASRLAGGKFANGAVTAAFGYAFNQMSHAVNATEAQEESLASLDPRSIYGSDRTRETKFFMNDSGEILGKTQDGCYGGDRCTISTSELPEGTSLVGHTHAPAELLQSRRIRTSSEIVSNISRDIPGPGDAIPLKLGRGYPSAVITPGGYRYVIDSRGLTYLGGGNPEFGAFVQNGWHVGINDAQIRQMASDWKGR
jgi:hypothetical protein